MTCTFHFQTFQNTVLSDASIAGQTVPVIFEKDQMFFSGRAAFWAENFPKYGHILVMAEKCLAKFGLLEGVTAFLENVTDIDQYYDQMDKLKMIFSLGVPRLAPRLKEFFIQHSPVRSLIMETLALILPPAELEEFMFQTAFPLIFDKDNHSLQEQLAFLDVVTETIPSQENHQKLLDSSNQIYNAAKDQLDRNRGSFLRNHLLDRVRKQRFVLDYQTTDPEFFRVNRNWVLAENEVYRLWQTGQPLPLESETKIKQPFHLVKFALEEGMTDLTKFKDDDFISFLVGNGHYFFNDQNSLFIQEKVLPFLKKEPARYLELTKKIILMQASSSEFTGTCAYFMLWHAPDSAAANQLLQTSEVKLAFQKNSFLKKDNEEYQLLHLHWTEQELTPPASLPQEATTWLNNLKKHSRKRQEYIAFIAQSPLLLESLEQDLKNNQQSYSADLLYWAWTVAGATVIPNDLGTKLIPAIANVIQKKAKDYYHAYPIPSNPLLFDQWQQFLAKPEQQQARFAFLKRYSSLTEKHGFSPDQQQKIKLFLEDIWRQDQPDLPYYTNDSSGLMDLLVEVGDQQTKQIIKQQSHYPAQRGEIMVIARLHQKLRQQKSKK